MVREKPPIERRWRNATLLFLGTFIACAIVAVNLVYILPSDMNWFGIGVPLAIATLGTMAGGIGVLCAIRLITIQVQSGDDD